MHDHSMPGPARLMTALSNEWRPRIKKQIGAIGVVLAGLGAGIQIFFLIDGATGRFGNSTDAGEVLNA